MKKFLVILSCLCMFLSACDSQKSEEKQAENTQNTIENSLVEQEKRVEDNPENFTTIFNAYTPAQKYYFCAAFSIEAIAVSKPATAVAMIHYFLGLGVVQYSQGIDEATFEAFDLGKNIFTSETIVNNILENKTCENIIVSAAEFAQREGYDTEILNDKGAPEAEKLVLYLKQ